MSSKKSERLKATVELKIKVDGVVKYRTRGDFGKGEKPLFIEPDHETMQKFIESAIEAKRSSQEALSDQK